MKLQQATVPYTTELQQKVSKNMYLIIAVPSKVSSELCINNKADTWVALPIGKGRFCQPVGQGVTVNLIGQPVYRPDGLLKIFRLL